MEVGDDNVSVEMVAEDALLMLRCLSGGKDVHIHLCFMMARNANIGMAKIWMGKITNELLEVMA